MSNEQHNVKNNSNGTRKAPVNTTQDRNENTDTYEMQYNQPQTDNLYEENEGVEEAERYLNDKVEKKQNDKPLKMFGIICIAITIVSYIFSGTTRVDTSESARNALTNKVSTAVSGGVILLKEDENVEPKDYSVTHKSNAEDTKIWVWDYAGEDGDYVQVLVNGAPIGDAFMIRHKTRELTVPSTGKVQIKGIKDGGGGITYAVRYDINGTSYFNGTPEGELNTYTLRRE